MTTYNPIPQYLPQVLSLFEAEIRRTENGICLMSNRIKGRRTITPVILFCAQDAVGVNDLLSDCKEAREIIRHQATLNFKDFDYDWGFYAGERGDWVINTAPCRLSYETPFLHLPPFVNWPHFFWETPSFIAAGVFHARPVTHEDALYRVVSTMVKSQHTRTLKKAYDDGGLEITTLHMIDPKQPRLHDSWETVILSRAVVNTVVQEAIK